LFLEDKDLGKDYLHLLERDLRRWNLSDVNKDGSLTKEEYICFTHPEACEHMKNIIVLVSIRQLLSFSIG